MRTQKEIITAIRERIENYKELYAETKMEGSLDKWEAMVELYLYIIKGDSS